MITPELAEFVEAGVSMLVGTRDGRLFPESVRATGARAHLPGDELTVFVPCATGETTRANLLDNGRVAACFARIQDHHTLQLKGTLLELREALSEERPVIERYRAKLAESLAWVGVPPRLSLRIAFWPSLAVRFRVESVFDQTPGPGAGEALRATSQDGAG